MLTIISQSVKLWSGQKINVFWKCYIVVISMPIKSAGKEDSAWLIGLSTDKNVLHMYGGAFSIRGCVSACKRKNKQIHCLWQVYEQQSSTPLQRKINLQIHSLKCLLLSTYFHIKNTIWSWVFSGKEGNTDLLIFVMCQTLEKLSFEVLLFYLSDWGSQSAF